MSGGFMTKMLNGADSASAGVLSLFVCYGSRLGK